MSKEVELIKEDTEILNRLIERLKTVVFKEKK